MTWDLDPVLIHASGFEIRWYGLVLTLALLGGFFQLQWLIRRRGASAIFDTVVLYGFIGGVLGARLGHFLLYETQAWLADPLIFLAVDRPGLASHTSIAGVIIAMWFAGRRSGRSPWQLSAWWVPSYVLAAGIIRIGNFFNSELIGTPTDVPWQVTFRLVDEIGRHPVQLYESLTCFACYGYLHWRLRRGIDDISLLATGILFMSLARFMTEFFKADQSMIEANLVLNLGQFLTLPYFALVFWLLLKKKAAP